MLPFWKMPAWTHGLNGAGIFRNGLLAFRLRSIGSWSGGDFLGLPFSNIDAKASWGEGWGLGVALLILLTRVILHSAPSPLVGTAWCCLLRRGPSTLRPWMGFQEAPKPLKLCKVMHLCAFLVAVIRFSVGPWIRTPALDSQKAVSQCCISAALQQESFRLHPLSFDNRKMKCKASKAMAWAGFAYGAQGTPASSLEKASVLKQFPDAMKTGNHQGSVEHWICWQIQSPWTTDVTFLSLSLQVMIHKMGLIPTSWGEMSCRMCSMCDENCSCSCSPVCSPPEESRKDLPVGAVLLKLQRADESPGDLV